MIRQFKSAGKYSILIPAFVMAHRNLARTYEAKGLYSESVEESLEAAALEGRTPVQVADARRAFAETRVVGFWRTFVRQEKASAEGDPYRIAECYSRLNEPDLALHWLERAFDQHSPHMWALDRDETFSSIRGDPRFKALLQRLHLS